MIFSSFLRYQTSLFFLICSSYLYASDTPDPEQVGLPGNYQALQGCSGDWQPDCELTHMEFNPVNGIWTKTLTLSSGDWQYKAALNNNWDENYGANAVRGGGNIELFLDQTSTVKFYYDHETHWVTDNQNSRIVTVPGNFQEFLGCSANWQPDCLRSWLQDPENDGIYTMVTQSIPAGSYEAKAALNENWDVNYGQDGIQNGPNIPFTVSVDNSEVFFRFDSQTNVLTISTEGQPKGNLALSRAHWLDADTFAWDADIANGDNVFLYHSLDATLVLESNTIIGGERIPLALMGELSSELQELFPHLSQYSALSLNSLSIEQKRELAKQQLALAIFDNEGNLKDATSIQFPGALDSLFYFDGVLGPHSDNDEMLLSLWAPTARSVNVLLFDSPGQSEPSDRVILTEDPETGVWISPDLSQWNRKYYLYEVSVYSYATRKVELNRVTDPYSLSLSSNSEKSQLINLDDQDLKPFGWDWLWKPRLRAPEDISIYELHIRDFSIADLTVPESLRGTYKAFTLQYSNSVRHLKRLSRSGLTHIHLLPTFDIATVNENRSEQKAIIEDLSLLAPDSVEQQAAVAAIQSEDGFNWGYDPYHYTVPEGSYSTEPNGITRIVEFRKMVAALNRMGLRVVMDVVYNHTNSWGQFDKSVLDKIVPGYFHRYDANGQVEMSSCCPNTASENRMMEKLMLDSLLTWAKAYKVDGFRFDLMGHHTKSNILKAKDALAKLTVAHDGINGKSIYLYGEGWNFGEVVNNTRFEQATQLNMGGTGVGSFDDRGRDAIRGGNPFGGYQDQGFGNGLYSNPNGIGDDQLSTLLALTDRVRISLAGGLADFQFENAEGENVTAAEVDYNGLPAGYTQDPQELISYIAAHDNETLFDALQLKAPLSTSTRDRARMQNFGNALVLLGQGVPFIHAGQDFLRSKSMDRDSFNSGDWFNALDFTFNTSGWGRGLPIEEKNLPSWPIMAPLLANPDIAPSKQDRQFTAKYFRELLAIRYSSPLFRLQTKDDIMKTVSFLNTGPDQTPGLVVMRLASGRHKDIVVLFNGSNDTIRYSHESLNKHYSLHPIQRRSVDFDLDYAFYHNGEFSVPPMTAAVFKGFRTPYYWKKIRADFYSYWWDRWMYFYKEN